MEEKYGGCGEGKHSGGLPGAGEKALWSDGGTVVIPRRKPGGNGLQKVVRGLGFLETVHSLGNGLTDEHGFSAGWAAVDVEPKKLFVFGSGLSVDDQIHQ